MLAKTGLTVREHQERTIANYLELRDHGPFIPVLQGWTLDDYERCVTLYALAGVDLTEQPLVGLGSVCRRQDTDEIDEIVTHLAGHGLNLHGFGVKKAGVSAYGDFLSSADSLAWSFRARRSDPMPGCTHKTCANCIRFAMHWREEVLARQVEVLAAPRQLRMFTGTGSATPWTITDAGKEALKPQRLVGTEKPVFMARGSGTTSERAMAIDDVELADPPSAAWLRVSRERRAGAQDPRKAASRAARTLRAA
jgi:hypothetical protein